MENIKEFEHISIFRGDLENYSSIIEDFKKQFEGFEITKFEEIGIKTLAYDVKGLKKGYYVLIEFKASEYDIAQLERYCRINDNIIKFIIIRK